MDFNTIFSYGAEVKVDALGTLDLGEVSLGSISGSQKNGGSLDSKLCFIDPAHLANLKSLPKPIYVDWEIVKIENGRLVPGTDAEVAENKAIRLVFKYGVLLPEGKQTHVLPSALKDHRNIGLLDLQFTIFYQMDFQKPGKDISIWQTAETIMNTADGSVSMKLVSFTDEGDFSKLKSLKYQTRVESVPSTWSDKKDKFVHKTESDWAHKIWFIKWDKTDKYTLEKAWSADIPVEPKDAQFQQSSNSNSSMGQTQSSSFSISATTSGNITTVKWTETAGATSYKLSLTYPNGGVKDFNSSENSISLKNLPPGVYKATVTATSASGATLSTGSGQITN